MTRRLAARLASLAYAACVWAVWASEKPHTDKYGRPVDRHGHAIDRTMRLHERAVRSLVFPVVFFGLSIADKLPNNPDSRSKLGRGGW